MAILDDLKTYLASAGVPTGKYTDPTLSSVLAVELAAQDHKCFGAGGLYPDLNEALFRRVYVNLSKRGLPLGVVEMSGDGGGSFQPRVSDPEVRRLEAPYRRLVTG